MTTETQTLGQWLEELSLIDTSNKGDEVMITKLLDKIGFTEAVTTCGIVYLAGHGTAEYPPVSIHRVAQMILAVNNKKK